MAKSRIQYVIIALVTLNSCNNGPVKKLANYKVKGIDVSHYQGQIDWSLTGKDEIDFCYIKATEGKSYKDPLFKFNLQQAKFHGLKVGAYHYYRFKVSPKGQFDNYTQTAKKLMIDLPPAIDVEYKNNEILYNRRNKKLFIEELKLFLSMIEDHYGVKPIIYTNVNFYNNLLSREINDNLWISDLRSKSLNYLDSSQWVFWQHSFVGRKKGINSYVDLNVFNGEKNKLHELMHNKR